MADLNASSCYLIIGGTSGIGFSAARAFLERGDQVVLLGDPATDASDARRLTGTRGLVIQADARDPASVPAAIEMAVEQFGRINGLYHVAGGSGRKFGDGPLHQCTYEGWQKTLELNLNSLMLSNQAIIRHWMNEEQGGSILNLSSVLAFSPSPAFFSTHAYAAAKAAVIGLSRSLASYYATYNIRVNVLVPGLVETPMSARAAGDSAIMEFIRSKQPLDGGRIGRADDLDGLALYFLSPASRFTTGQVISVDGGWDLSEGQTGYS